MSSFILVLVNGLDGDLPEAITSPFSVKQHVLLVFKTFAWDRDKPVQRFCRKASESCLGIPDFYSCKPCKNPAGQCVAHPAPTRYLALKGSASQYDFVASRLYAAGCADDILYRVLAVAIRRYNDGIRIQALLFYPGKSGLQGCAFAPVFLIAQYPAAIFSASANRCLYASPLPSSTSGIQESVLSSNSFRRFNIFSSGSYAGISTTDVEDVTDISLLSYQRTGAVDDLAVLIQGH